ncbi:MAG: ABC transporter permease [Pyrinomonadaceae bacterium]|nr:ABC transporter permease [Phycisphaerales bacterium]
MTQIVVRSSRQVPIADLLNLPLMLRNLWRYRDLIRQFTIREVGVRHKGTALGLTWAILQPLLTLSIYTFIFGFVFKNRWGKLDGFYWADFTLNFFAGYVVYSIFSDTVNRSPGFITEHPNLVRKVVFPLEILPLTATGASLIYSGFGIALLLIATGALAQTFSWTIIFFPLVLLPLLMLTLGISWLFASLGAFIRDFRQVVPVLTQLVFFMTPIFYDVKNIDPQFRWIIMLNPMTLIVENARKTLLWSEMPDWQHLGVLYAVALVVMILGYAWFTKSKRGLADVL